MTNLRAASAPLNPQNSALEVQMKPLTSFDALLQYATRRIVELEAQLLVDVQETVWPAEVAMVYSQVERAGKLPAHHQRRLKHHINRMWLEEMPVPSIITAARSLAAAMENYA